MLFAIRPVTGAGWHRALAKLACLIGDHLRKMLAGVRLPFFQQLQPRPAGPLFIREPESFEMSQIRQHYEFVRHTSSLAQTNMSNAKVYGAILGHQDKVS